MLAKAEQLDLKYMSQFETMNDFWAHCRDGRHMLRLIKAFEPWWFRIPDNDRAVQALLVNSQGLPYEEFVGVLASKLRQLHRAVPDVFGRKGAPVVETENE
jgi:hypothetical protein